MSSLLIRGAKIEKAEMSCANNGQRTIKITFRASWSDTVCREMGWSEEPVGFGNGSLDGQLFGISMMLEPSSKTLKDYRIDIPISQVGSFKHRAKTEDEHTVKREIEFVVTTVADDAAVVIDNYIKHVGPGAERAQCKITYSSEEQQELGEGGAPAEPEKTRGRRKAAESVQ